MDANFKLKDKERGIKDFELDPGWGSYVQNEHYQVHVEWHVDQPEVTDFLIAYMDDLSISQQINSCDLDHDAIACANTAVPGYSVNGTALVLCSRHSMVCKNGVGDLQKGEK